MNVGVPSLSLKKLFDKKRPEKNSKFWDLIKKQRVISEK